eukprot:6489680-Amphidinium_carterae.1
MTSRAKIRDVLGFLLTLSDAQKLQIEDAFAKLHVDVLDTLDLQSTKAILESIADDAAVYVTIHNRLQQAKQAAQPTPAAPSQVLQPD